jgi:hypothetical protein
MYWRRDCGPQPRTVPQGRAGFFVWLPSIDEAAMRRESIAHVPPPSTLTADEAVTLRRVAFGQSDVRTLRQADLARLLELRLIVGARGGLELTRTGRDLFDTLPRAVFAARPR